MNHKQLPIRAFADNPMHKPWADLAGMFASIGCAIHCAAMPLVLAYLPAFGLEWLADEGFHCWMAAICFALAAAAFVSGGRKHGSLAPAMWGTAGLLLLTTAAYGLEGACCAACSNESPNSVASLTVSDADGPLCQSTLSVESRSDRVLTQFVPLATPMGGVLLVIGHIANHRKSCVCRGNHCCLTTEESERDE